MFYLYNDTSFQGKIIRLIRAEHGQKPLSDDLIKVLRLTHEQNENVIAFIKDYNNTFHSFRNEEERALWKAYLAQHPLLYDEYYTWQRAHAEV